MRGEFGYLLVNELQKYFSNKSVHIVYLCLGLYWILTSRIMVTDDLEMLVIAPSICSLGGFGAVIGFIMVYLTICIWSTDLDKGTIKNAFSGGIDRRAFFGAKLVMVGIQSFAFDFVVTVCSMIGVMTGGALTEIPDRIITNMGKSVTISFLYSFVAIYATAMMSTVFIFIIKNTFVAYVVASCLSLAEAIASSITGKWLNINCALGPYSSLTAELVTLREKKALYIPTYFWIVLIGFICVGTGVSYYLSLKKEF